MVHRLVFGTTHPHMLSLAFQMQNQAATTAIAQLSSKNTCNHQGTVPGIYNLA